MAGATNNRAVYLVFARFVGFDADERWFSRLNRFVDAQIFDLKSMLDVAGGNLEDYVLTFFYVDHRRLETVTMRGYLNVQRFFVALTVAACQQQTC